MRAVNLLPEKHRPRRPTGGKSGSSYVLLGALGAIVVGVLLYVLTVNSINSSKTSIADAKAEAQRANAQADALGAYGDFAKVKAQREESVKQLAQQRVDWERLVRELAHVLPNGVWIASAQASDGSGDPAAGAASASPDASTGQPSLTLTGCAESQREVADTLVRTLSLPSDSAESSRVYVHLGGVTNLAIALGSICLFTRPLSTAWDQDGDSVAAELAEEIRLSVDFYMAQPDARWVGEVVLSGPGARREGLADELGGMIDVPVTVAEPLGRLGENDVPATEDPARHTIAAGLALGAAA